MIHGINDGNLHKCKEHVMQFLYQCKPKCQEIRKLLCLGFTLWQLALRMCPVLSGKHSKNSLQRVSCKMLFKVFGETQLFCLVFTLFLPQNIGFHVQKTLTVCNASMLPLSPWARSVRSRTCNEAMFESDHISKGDDKQWISSVAVLQICRTL